MKWWTIFKLASAVFALHILPKSATATFPTPPCRDLKMLPSPYSYNGTDVINLPIACVIEGHQNHTLNVFDLIAQANTDYIITGVKGYTFVHIYLNCSEPSYIDFDTDGRVNMTFVVAVRIKDCIATYGALSRLGESVYLIAVALNYIHMAPPILSDEELQANYSGLDNMFQFSISINYNLSGNFHVDKILPVLPAILGLDLICVDEFYNHLKCPNNNFQQNIKLDLEWLQINYYQLQSLHLSSVDVSIVPGDRFYFPWTNETRPLPLNLSRSSFQQRQYTNGIKTLTNDNLVRRVFSFGNSPRVTMDELCPFTGPLDKVDLARQLNVSIPEDCFWATPNITSIDIVNNTIDQFSFPQKIFQGLFQLRSLNLASNALDVVQCGLFDDLINLETLNLDANNISNLTSGIFKSLKSLEVLYIYKNKLEYVAPGSLPIYSENLRFIDFRQNHLKQFVSDCLKFSNLAICDMDDNMIDLQNLQSLVRDHFSPVQLLFVEPLAYNGEPLVHYNEGVPHEPDQTRISLRSNNIITIPVNLTEWTEFDMKQMTALIDFFQINLSDNKLHCDCSMYDMKRLLTDTKYMQNLPGRPLSIARYRETRQFGHSNLKSWKCQVHHLLGNNRTEVAKMADEYFVCNTTDTEPDCPERCTCYKSPINVANGRILVDCSGKNLTEFPKRMPVPDAEHSDLLVSFQHNDLHKFPKCSNYNCTGDYEWLHYVTELNLEHNTIQPEEGNENKSSNLLKFLNSLTQIKQLKLAYNNIVTLPEEIRFMNFTNLTITRNHISCNCYNRWMRDWIREKNQSISDSLVLTCIYGPRPIVQLTDEDFLKHCGSDDATYSLLTLLMIPIIMGLVSCSYFRRELNLIIFEKVGIKFMDRMNQEKGKKYDALLVYAEDDSQWAQEILLKNLEYIYKYDIADYARDSEYGRGRSEENCQLLASAQRAIVVMSNSFIADNECMKIFSEARSYCENKRFLLLIKMEHLDLDDTNRAHLDIINFLKTNFYVDIRNTNRCLARLCYWMPIAKTLPPLTEHSAREYILRRRITRPNRSDDDVPLINNII